MYDIVFIVYQLCYLESPFGTWTLPPDWTRPYVWSMAVLMAFNCYFCWIIVKKSFPSRFARVTSIRESGIHEVPLTDRLSYSCATNGIVVGGLLATDWIGACVIARAVSGAWLDTVEIKFLARSIEETAGGVEQILASFGRPYSAGYEIFDTIHTNKRNAKTFAHLSLKRLAIRCPEVASDVSGVSPYAFIHHICSILAITMSAFAMSDYNLVLHLAVCMEFSGLWLAACKLVSRHSIAGLFGKSSKGGVDSRWMLAVYLPCRVLFPLYDVSLIIVHLCCLESPSGSWSLPPQWARPYVCCYAALFAFYCYFCWVLVKKSLPGHFRPRARELRTISLFMLNHTIFQPTLEVAASRTSNAAAATPALRSPIVSGLQQATGPYCVISKPCVLELIAQEAQVPLPRYTLESLLALEHLSKHERTAHLLHNLKRGVAICGYELQCYPFGFGCQPSVKHVVDNYLQDFYDISKLQAEMGDNIVWSPEVKTVMDGIFTRHKGTMIDIARGVLEFQESVRSQYDARCTLLHTREAVPAITHIERRLDDFFSTRISCRLMISHILALNEINEKDLAGERWPSPHRSSSDENMHMLNEKPRMVGSVTTNTMPVLVLQQAYEAAKYMCRRDYNGLAPDLVVNGMSLEEYLTVAPPQRSFAYVVQHLFYIFLEILKNAMRASVEKALFDSGGDYQRCKDVGLPPVTVTLPDLSSMWDFERTIKIADQGYGMKREILKRASSYFYSSATQKPDGTRELPDFDSRAPLAGFGFGLPISKVMARYFEGDLEVNSIPGAGTDVYIYL
ncbi:pyruvate dehydrogenase, putative [Perkinsus marinus ATCC 50983]|uniref:Protein-serine/threonine kinase n=1 Tax=Perkinsus marinus (strain ATCC 50983 / TXsc) TaxID=423536 RepID=C5K780_PERM5|nr:pyruvate dehydrogenase, putative [Perkinsus marinus ATCC 50983]EER19415.1 pyruvate dehydrogenase, putative [Perkinsus marinus ATCC 50983]|eukprot:XP_002787619.1 pyruvate dehydrogenase, putative [Perkinsus marinus ATCC 50983]